MKRVLLLVAISLATGSGFAQSTETEEDLINAEIDTVLGWHKTAFFGLTGTQTSLTNWVAGGQNSISINGTINLAADLNQENWSWENSLDLGYGLLRQGDALFEDNGEKWIKTDDRIDLFSKYGRRASKNLYYAALTNFRTQFTAGYNYAVDDVTEISGFLAPAYSLTALGFDYKPKLKKGTSFSLFAAPVTTKLTFVNDTILANAGSFGVDEAFVDENGVYVPGKKFRAELGGYIRMKYKTKLSDNIRFSTNLDLFSNYLNNPSRIDVNWETLVQIELISVLSLSVGTHLIYDDDINIDVLDADGELVGRGPRAQFKQIFTLGLAYSLDNHKNN